MGAAQTPHKRINLIRHLRRPDEINATIPMLRELQHVVRYFLTNHVL
jgi:hypothetical protein